MRTRRRVYLVEAVLRISENHVGSAAVSGEHAGVSALAESCPGVEGLSGSGDGRADGIRGADVHLDGRARVAADVDHAARAIAHRVEPPADVDVRAALHPVTLIVPAVALEVVILHLRSPLLLPHTVEESSQLFSE